MSVLYSRLYLFQCGSDHNLLTRYIPPVCRQVRPCWVCVPDLNYMYKFTNSTRSNCKYI